MDKHRIAQLKRTKKFNKATKNSTGTNLHVGRLPLPPRCNIWTRFAKQIDISNAAVPYANIRFQPTFAYDVDPVVGSTAMPFFSEMAGLYRFYRCIESRITVNLANADSAPVTCVVCPVNFDPGVNTASFQNYFSNPLSHHDILASTSGNSKGRLTASARTDSFAGAKWTGAIDGYCGPAAGTTAPNNNWYWFVGGHNLNNFTNGFFADVIIDIHLCFFEETSPSS